MCQLYLSPQTNRGELFESRNRYATLSSFSFKATLQLSKAIGDSNRETSNTPILTTWIDLNGYTDQQIQT